jgi:hypothetical protein
MTAKASTRYALTFVAGLAVGAVVVDVLALHALEFQAASAGALLWSEQHDLAQVSRCDGDWLGVALHSWNEANASARTWSGLRPDDYGNSFADPIRLGVHALRYDLPSQTGPNATIGLARVNFARALEHLGRPEAQSQWEHAARLSGMSVDFLKQTDAPRLICADSKMMEGIRSDLGTTGHGADVARAP